MTPAKKQVDARHAVSQVEIACPECLARYRVAAHLVGRRFQCRRCTHVWRWQLGANGEQPSVQETGPSDSNLGALPDSEGLPTAGMTGSSVIDTNLAGRRLGRYTLQSILGRGGMGVVWRGHDPSLKRDVAIKILTQPGRGTAAGSLSQQLFLQEARAAAKLNHPGAITVFEIAQDGGYHFIAMELMREGTLKDRVDREGAVEPRELFELLAPPARALALAHQRGIIHRDIKPGNLMFDDHGNLKLGDFGLSDVAGDPASMRMKGRAVGSLGWIAPETARGEPTTAASDIFAFGLVLYYALSGKPWIFADSRSRLLELHQNPPDLHLDEIEGLSPDGEALLHRCLAKDPADRFQSADDLATFLEHCAEVADEPPAALAPIPAAPPRPQWRMIVASAIGGIAIVVAAVLVVRQYTRWLDTPIPARQTPHAPTSLLARPAAEPPPPAAPRPPAEVVPAVEAPTDARDRRTWVGEVPEASLAFIASANGKVFHKPTCDGGRKIHLVNFRSYPSAEAASADGKTPCPYCLPSDAPMAAAEAP